MLTSSQRLQILIDTVRCMAVLGLLVVCSQTSNCQTAPIKPLANPAPTANGTPCPPRAKVLWVLPTDSGDVVQGPVCIKVVINALRYSSTIKTQTVVTAGSDLSSVFTVAKGTPDNPTVDQIVKAVVDQGAVWVRLDKLNNQQLAILNNGIAGLRDLVASSDVIFGASKAEGILKALNSVSVHDGIDAAQKASWGTSDDIYSNLKAIQLLITQTLLSNPAPADADKSRLTGAETALEGLLTALSPSTINGDKTTAFQKQKRILAWWTNYTAGLVDSSSFVIARYVPCNLFGNQTKNMSATIGRFDLLPTFDGSAASNADLTNAVITVNCSSPFVVSAGVEFSLLKNNTFGIVPSAPSGSTQFGITNTATISPIPLAMVHGRLWETSDHKLGVYFGFGVGAHTQDAAAGGSAAEYLTGVGIGLFHTIFLTPGLHLGKVAALNGGFKVGDPVPSGVTTVPVKSSYASGFGLAITFTKP